MNETPTLKTITLDDLRHAVGQGAALRCRRRLQPACGPGDKVFPPTYEGGQYATEERVIEGRRLPCVLLDSVQSQANRMEEALKNACYKGKDTPASIPFLVVDFSATSVPEVREVTSLDAPHRLADAILRDSSLGGKPFRGRPGTVYSDEGAILDTASVQNATGIYGLCPTALIFGLWDSTGPRGGLGTKFQRAMVGEIAAIDAATGARGTSRIDPLGIQLNAGTLYVATDGGWTLDEAAAKAGKDGKPLKLGKDGKPSEANHGNVTPSLKDNQTKQPHHGGVTMAYALQTVVISLPALRRLRFPLDGADSAKQATADIAARTALAALSLCGATLSIEAGCDLRSRCLLVPEPGQAGWEVVHGDGRTAPFALDANAARSLLAAAADAASKAGLPDWQRLPLVLQPNQDLVTLVKKSRELAMASGTEG